MIKLYLSEINAKKIGLCRRWIDKSWWCCEWDATVCWWNRLYIWIYYV